MSLIAHFERCYTFLLVTILKLKVLKEIKNNEKVGIDKSNLNFN